MTDKSLQFCPHCGTGIGKWFREGEVRGSCCPTEVVYSENHKEKVAWPDNMEDLEGRN